jgi:3-methyladenine DNA glycosylase AlkD
MTLNQTMKDLKKHGTAQNVKIYKRHGAGDKLYGVSFANLTAMKKKITVDHDLALQLWETGNADARTLAIMIVDPAQLTASVANRWIADVSYYLLSDLLAGPISKTRFAVAKMEQWMKSKKEFVRQCGYNILTAILVKHEGLSDTQCRQYLKTIENEIHQAPNRARHAMNMALIAIGIYKPALTKTVIAAAKRIGTVAVDHGETACKTPAAIPYIEKAHKRKKT